MKLFKSIREGNSVEPGVSEINDVQDDPLSFVEIKPKKSKAVKEGIVDTAAKAKALIFSSIDRKKKELYKNAVKEDIHEVTDNDMAHSAHMYGLKHGREGAGDNMDRAKAQYGTLFKHYNAGFLKGRKEKAKSLKAFSQGYGKVKEDLQEAVSVKKEKHSWGTMMTIHHGSDTSYPLHPEHQSAIKKLRPGMKTTFKDETNSTVHAHREGDTVHLTRPKTGSTLTSLPYHHFDTSEHAKPAAKKPAGEYDRKVTDHLKKKYNEENMVETKGAPKGFHFTKDGKLKRGDANQDGDGGTMLRADPLDKQRNKVPAVSEGIDFAAIWNGIKPVHEEVKTTHEDPLVLTKDAEGNIHTHANLSVANAIHGTDVKHQAIHTGKPVQAGKFTFELSKHHEGALKEDAPFDPVAHKKELDRLMGKHIEAHKAVSKAFADAKAKGKEPSFDIPENQKLNDIKKEIAAHKGKVPSGPAPAPGSAAHYYASKKPGEYTGD